MRAEYDVIIATQRGSWNAFRVKASDPGNAFDTAYAEYLKHNWRGTSQPRFLSVNVRRVER